MFDMGKVLKIFATFIIGFWGWQLATTNATIVEYLLVIGGLSVWGIAYLKWKSPSDNWSSILSVPSISTSDGTSSTTSPEISSNRAERDIERGFSHPVSDEQKVREIWEDNLKDGYDKLPSRNVYEKMVDKADEWHNSNKKEEFIVHCRTRNEDNVRVAPSTNIDSVDDLPGVNYDNEELTDTEVIIDSIERVNCRTCSGSGLHCNTCDNSNQMQCTDPNCEKGIITTPCNNCDKYGEINEDCSVCDGSGYSVEQQCNKCGGSGDYRDHEGDLISCRVCDGGVFREQCESCNGDGEIYQDCPKCDGGGSIQQGQCNTCSQYPHTDSGMIPCSQCNGGDDRSKCSNCEGQGWVNDVTVAWFTEKIGNKREIISSDIPFSSLSSHAMYQNVTDSKFNSEEELRENRNPSMADEEPMPNNLTDNVDVDGEIISIQYKYSETQTLSTYRYKHTDKVREYDGNIDKKYGLKSQYGPLSDSALIVSVTIDSSSNVVLESSDTSGLAHTDAI